ncbi:MAG: diaminopimelate decarboxylase [Verrucomicrobiota bacterium]
MHFFHQKNGRLYVEEISVETLAKKHGTPLYVYSAETILHHYRALQSSFSSLRHTICYAVKANSNLAILSLLAKQGAGFDIVSGVELQRVIRAGGTPSKCTFAGVGKTRAEIEFALKKNIYCFIVESEAELKHINNIAGRMGKKAPVAVRVNPNVAADTHHKITTGTYENKFGIVFEKIPALYARASKLKHLRLRGVQMHIGSQITSVKPFVLAVKKMLPLVQKLRDQYDLEFFDIGGGLGIVYDPALESGHLSWWKRQKNPPITSQIFAQSLAPLLAPLKMRVIIEPGRFMVGNAGILVAQVLYTKKTDRKNFVIVDAAMNDLIRPAFYGAYHQIVPLKMSRSSKQISIDVVGPICESGDVFCKHRALPLLREGEFLAFMSAGAYGFTMSSNYNSRLRAAEILAHGKKFRMIRRRETFSDIIRGE